MAEMLGQSVVAVTDAGLLAVSSDINHHVGTAAVLLTRPTGATILVAASESGDWRARLGDRTSAGMPGSAAVSESVTDGSGSLLLAEGKTLSLPAPSSITFKGYAADSVLTYYWI